MLIGIISDTHRNTVIHTQVIEALSMEGVERIYHLGDDYCDSELEAEYGIEVIRVPGLYCPEYKDKHVDNVAYDTIQGTRVVMAHDLKDIPESDFRCHEIMLHGHTHRFEIEVKNGRITMNPGHLKSLSDKGRPPSYGILEIDMGEIKTAILSPEGKTLLEMRFRREDTGLYKI